MWESARVKPDPPPWGAIFIPSLKTHFPIVVNDPVSARALSTIPYYRYSTRLKLNLFWNDFEIPRNSPSWQYFAAVMLLPYQLLLLLVAVVAMIRTASSINLSVIRLDAVKSFMVLHIPRATQAGHWQINWTGCSNHGLSSIVNHYSFSSQWRSVSLPIDSFSIRRQWRNSSINRWPLCDFSSRLSTDERGFRYRQREIFLLHSLCWWAQLTVSVQLHLGLLSSSIVTHKRITVEESIVGWRGNYY